tara:strand:+ start:2894 stop:3250 length:357 start_codon:yes stop_codon:yes gene_type:complete
MEAKELRIGNIVNYFNDGEYSIISTLDWGYANLNNASHVDYELLKPIPLTEEWILKFGFKSLDYGEYGRGRYVLDCEYTDKGVYNFVIGRTCIEVDVTNVHQLQNLYFALTNEELTIK